ncbi:MAG: glutamate synthase large subunit [Candidatus Rokubacteria bacterium]|nr:glutamate synthase large subunit [Candidatus Rokubacteria bacterium]
MESQTSGADLRPSSTSGSRAAPATRAPDADWRFPLYDPRTERDACGTGFVADIAGHPSHRIIEQAIEAVINLTHRGAVSADGKTGDGAGILTQLPRRLFMRELRRIGGRLDREDDLAVGVIFFPQEPEKRRLCQKIVEGTLIRRGVWILGWREAPIDPEALGEKARKTLPDIQHLLVARPARATGDEFERALHLARKEIEQQVLGEGIRDFYIPSFSHRTIVYKGLFVAPQLPRFYRDLTDPLYESALAVFHQRYSTNTFPTWFLAQPFRMLAHNGEINTLNGNLSWTYARERELRSSVWRGEVDRLRPLILPDGSDSAMLDNVLEALVLSGRDIRHAFMMLVPEAWEQMPHMDPELRAFYEYHACITEPWDGPAALAFSDGVIVGATLDRNGLRPARFAVTEDGLCLMGSEVGLLPLDPARIVRKGRLGPGQMIAVDVRRGVLLDNDAIKRQFATQQDYGKWLTRHLVRLDDVLPDATNGDRPLAGTSLVTLQAVFGYTEEELKYVLKPMFAEKKEPVWSMGDDTPLAVLSPRPRPLYGYFKQRFAQVTNPPIDPLREQLVMSLNTYLGPRQSLLEETEFHGRVIWLQSPILSDRELEVLSRIPAFPAIRLSTLFPVAEGAAGLEAALHRLTEEASHAADAEYTLIILSDRGVDEAHAAVPILMVVGALQHHLIRHGKRMKVSLLCETAEAWEVHHAACLIGYGASAVNPYLAFQTVRQLAATPERSETPMDPDLAVSNYKTALEYGLRKVMSKMGISTVTSYQGAQIFEAIGLARAIIDRCFGGTPSRVGGIGFEEIAAEVLERHREGFAAARTRLPDTGFYRFRKGGEQHAFNPNVIKAFHAATKSGRYEDYKRYAELVNTREPLALRDLMAFRPDRRPIPAEEVEPVSAIVRRFSTQAMSIGALGPEAHKTLATAMNRLGARSNTGEGGEDPEWWHPLPNGDLAASKIKQVASARFGVTPEYLIRAEQLEIKMAQGSKPGEGGQLPGHKVAAHIARIRRATPGIPLISPPPHHDIYSIEDLAQLIYDLKMVNPRAKVCVKLVSEAGVGTIAAGVAKGYADVVLISGHDGGTGASPVSSIKNAGVPWELGLSETQQVLVMNDLRGRVTLRVDGGMKTGRDVVVAALLGAEEFGFGTASVVSIGCIMARQCHLNTCPVGIATQREDLRAKFAGTPDMAIHFFTHVAEDVREILAGLGYRTLDDIVGRTDLLVAAPRGDGKVTALDLSKILTPADPDGARPHRCVQPRNDRPDEPLDRTLLADARPAVEEGRPVRLSYPIRNIHRTVGARLAGEIARRYGDRGLPEGTIEIRFQGSAGQSFGAFCVPGMRLVLEGEANDYVGKGMGGGEIVVRPPATARFPWHENAIVGNTVLYGATGGALFVAGRAGERFGVRNSGATAVVEGVGDHGCEYMTAGCVIVLGETGRNFGAGMTNGAAFVLDETAEFPKRYNPELVRIARVEEPGDVARLRGLVVRHLEETGSRRAADLLARWDELFRWFWKVIPMPAEAIAKTIEVAKRGSEVVALSGSGR